MFLKSLTLKGFKSFADATVLDFEPGVTVVVGPNGSGKSNIVDAVAWVLGAQSPSALRSGKMDDVIFAGSGTRPALGRAEVSLTIDNSAGLLPVGLAEVTITRTLFRSSGESEYALNGAPCRLLDIQELLSDSGVGRTQHVIVSQGNLDSVLNARAEDRRTIIEEAAGVLKYRRRKQKAERRLEGTEANLLRLQDTLREVRRQLRPLERQADAARRHGDVVAELRALQLFLAGRELSAMQARRNAAAGALEAQTAEMAQVRSQLHRLDADVGAAEATVARVGGAELSVIAGRFEALRERARGLAAVVAERRRSVERDRAAFTDESLVAALEAEGARMVEELADVDDRAAALAGESGQLDAERASLDLARGDFDERAGIVGEASDAGERRGERMAIEASLAGDRDELERLGARLSALDVRRQSLDEDAERLRREIERVDAEEPPLAEALAAAERAFEAAGESRTLADAEFRQAELDRHTWTVRAEALAVAIAAAGQDAAHNALSGVDGVIGVLGEVIEIDDGWEAPVRAALGAALSAAVVPDADAGRRALARLHDESLPGTVLAADLLAATARPTPLHTGEPIRAHVRAADPVVDRLLDALLAAVAVVGPDLDAAVGASLASPELIVVTREGDRLDVTGWRTGGWDPTPSRGALEDARVKSESAAAAASTASHVLEDADGRLSSAGSAKEERFAALEAHDARLTELADALAAVESNRRDLAIEVDALQAHRTDLQSRTERVDDRLREVVASLTVLEAAEASGVERRRQLDAERSRLEERAAALAVLRTDIQVQAAALEERRAYLTRRRAEIDERLSRHAEERDAATAKRVELDASATRLTRLAEFTATRLETLDAALAEFHDRQRRQSEALRTATARLEGLRQERVAADRRMEELRELARRSELEEAEARLRLEAATEALRHDYDCEPVEAMAAVCPDVEPPTTPEERARELERDLRLMGPINPLALQEFTALSERNAFLEEQLADVKASRRELSKVIKAVDAEIVQVFAAAYADVADNFASLFETLFPGGHARLRLTEPDNLLETGIELEARPSGKNVRKLSLLSGGERSLTALAFLFAVFRSRPSPFYLLDEVEAALDDVNLHRFLDLLSEFRQEAQLLVVSHQKRTMEAADCLYGVTMAPGKSSLVVSERVATTA